MDDNTQEMSIQDMRALVASFETRFGEEEESFIEDIGTALANYIKEKGGINKLQPERAREVQAIQNLIAARRAEQIGCLQFKTQLDVYIQTMSYGHRVWHRTLQPQLLNVYIQKRSYVDYIANKIGILERHRITQARQNVNTQMINLSQQHTQMPLAASCQQDLVKRDDSLQARDDRVRIREPAAVPISSSSSSTLPSSKSHGVDSSAVVIDIDDTTKQQNQKQTTRNSPSFFGQ